MKRLIVLALIVALCMLIIPAMAVDSTQCQNDVNGVNDKPNQKDLTKFCVEAGTGSYDLWTSWNWDDTHMSGGNTADACSLYDTDNDGNVNLAVCAEWDDNQNFLVYRLFNCPSDNRPENCGGAVLISTPYLSTCTVSDSTDDPFPTGDYSPHDTKAVCSVDLSDFGVSDAKLIDACSYPSAQPSSDASDCVLYTGCSNDADCDDKNSCTTDTCDTSIHVCRHPANTGQSCGGSADNCDAIDTCNEQGFCDDNVDPAGTLCREDAGACDVPEYCDGATKTCPADTFEPSGTTCGGSAAECDAPDTCDGAGTCVDNVNSSAVTCRDSVGICDVEEKCDGTTKTCPNNAFEPIGTLCGGSAAGCDALDTCNGSGTCVDNVDPSTTVCRSDSGDCDVAEYCDGTSKTCPGDIFETSGTACGGSAEGCDALDTCNASGVCIDNVDPSTTVCRPDAGPCDVEEKCTGTSKTCPGDSFEPAGTGCGGSAEGCDALDTCNASGVCIDNIDPSTTVCRPDAGPCDVEEKCTGTSKTCPGNSFEPAGTGCGGSAADCDALDTCNGSGSCVDNVDPSTTMCRTDAGPCDVEEKCTGTSKTCPGDSFEPAGTGCGGSADDCDALDTCNGSGSCVDNVDPSTTVCRPDAGPCDVEEKCTGTSKTCPGDSFEPAGTGCGGLAADCDALDTCNGSGSCVDNVDPASTICRPAAGICDVPETCTGGSAACPTDNFVTIGTECRFSGGTCDIVEMCTGNAAACPIDGVKPQGTICNTGSGDTCDPDETCDGSNKECPSDTITSAATVCRSGSGDLCDPDENCPGVADQACPTDTFKGANFVCNIGSGDVCDPDEKCTGIAGAACPSDRVKGTDYTCRIGSGDVCDPDEKCSGVADATCPTDTFKDANFVCNIGSGDVCDPDEKCPGEAGLTCPTDIVTSAGTVCRAGSGDICNPDEECTGEVDQPCPPDEQLPPATECPDGECVNGICQYVPPEGVLLPTQTTCQMYAAGPSAWPPMYDAFTYNLNAKTGMINGISPGVIFYYNTIEAPAATFDFSVNQVNNQIWKPMLVQQESKKMQAYLYDTDCHIISTAQGSSGPNSDPYSVQFHITGATTGHTYYIGIKYTPQNLIRIKPEGITSIYSWSTNIGGNSDSGVSIPVEPGQTLTSSDITSSGPIYIKLG